MEAGYGGEACQLYGMGPMDLRAAVGKRNLEWDLNDWKWDGDLFIARPLNTVESDHLSRQLFPIVSGIPLTNGGSSNSSSSCSDEANMGIEKGKREVEKRRRVTVIEDENLNDEARTLSLKVGGNGSQIVEREAGSWEGTSGKKTKLAGGNSNRAVCQVEDCGADLSNAKDYHRRHKVCETHSKASNALVANVMQRFCQQCSRFHVLQEFDEGKRSCRRRLAGHNKRRRKVNPDNVVNGNSPPDEQTSSYLLLTLLRILANLHSNGSNQTTDQDLLSHLIRSLACQSSEHGGKNLSGILHEPQSLLNNGALMGKSDLVSTFLSNGPQASLRSSKPHDTIPISETPVQAIGRGGDTPAISSIKPSTSNSPPAYSEIRDSTVGQCKMMNFDLNDAYVDSDDGMEDIERQTLPVHMGTSSLECPSWVQQDSHQSSPPQTSGNSDSASAQSPSSSAGEAQSRTDRIILKLFGKAPNDFPHVLRAQVLDWLSHSPTEIESYIRPGCVVLTIYLRQTEASWDNLCHDLSTSFNRLLDVSDDAFWRTGWVYVRVQHQIAIVYHGQVVVDTSLPLRNKNYCRITSVNPVAVSTSKKAMFSVKGINLTQPTTRLLCAIEGKYLTQEASDGSTESGEDDSRCVTFSCSIPVVYGRGFIEVEDDGFSSSSFPFIVAEEDVCSEICTLQSALELTETCSNSGETAELEGRSNAMEFIHEIGWLFHRNQLKSRLGHLDPNENLFSLPRFKWLMEFSMDHDWCAVVKKLLDVLRDGNVDAGGHSSLNLALMEMGLLHRAVRKNSRSLVELLLRYPSKVKDASSSEDSASIDGGADSFLFRPNAIGPAGLTPLHIAAGKDDSEDVLDALTNDPGMVGVEAWKSARDSTGSTPEDYARLRGHYSYIRLVQRKINKRSAAGHVVLDIPSSLSDSSWNQKPNTDLASSRFEIGRMELKPSQQHCKLCVRKPLGCGTPSSASLVYRPAMLSMVAIAAVCVCVAHDARVDALTVNISLSDRGHVHYMALPSGRAVVDFSTDLSVRASGSVDINETGDQGFVVAGLTEGSSYDLYFRSETLESFGVFGEWTKEPVTARTHGLPAEVLVEAVMCKVTPSCEQRGRETCSRKENVCGKCLEGYETMDEAIPEANEPCVKLHVASEAKRGPKIKINSVTRNPNLHVSEIEMETDGEIEQKHESTQAATQEEPTLQVANDLEVEQQDSRIKEQEHVPVSAELEILPQDELITDSKPNEQMQIPLSQNLPGLTQGDSVDQGRSVTPELHAGADALGYIGIVPNAEPEHPVPTGCPLHSQPTVSGLCECIPGYEVDEGGTSCVLSRMETAAQAAATATSTTFDILNAHSHVSSQGT